MHRAPHVSHGRRDTARSVSLTEPGLRHSEFAARILAEVEAEEALIGHPHDRAEGALSVVCPKWIGSLHVGDAVAAFAAAHRKISVRFELGGLSERTYDFPDSGFDVALHTRDLRDPRSARLQKTAVQGLGIALLPQRSAYEDLV